MAAQHSAEELICVIFALRKSKTTNVDTPSTNQLTDLIIITKM